MRRPTVARVQHRIGLIATHYSKGNTMSLFNIRTWADVRAFLYVLLPVVSTMLVGNGVLTQDRANLWFALATAVLGPVIAAITARSLSLFRTAFYTVLGAGQALVIGYGIASAGFLDSWLPLIVTLIGASTGGVAAANTETSGGRHRKPE